MNSPLPIRVEALLREALHRLPESERDALTPVARRLAETTWQERLAARLPSDNRGEHEFVVLDNVLRIAVAEGLSFSEKRIAVAFAFLHDAIVIKRITEWEIRAAASPVAKAELEARKVAQRMRHMLEGAEFARGALKALGQLSSDEIDRCAAIIAGHDLWKLGRPHPAGDDRLALACIEGDALWPLHPLGVLADLERPGDDGRTPGLHEPDAWRRQLIHSTATLCEYRGNWKHESQADFQDDDSIFRTAEGGRIFRAWRRFWNV